MKNKKGTPNYIKKRKRTILLKNILEFGIVITLVILGYVQAKTRTNLLTVVAVLGCLPAAKALVELIMILPYHSIAEEKVAEIEEKTSSVTVAYDMVLTSEHHVMPIACIVVLDNTICGYAPHKKTDLNFAEKHIQQMLAQNQFGHIVVKLFDDYTAFLNRVEAMNKIAVKENEEIKTKEEAMCRLILNISL